MDKVFLFDLGNVLAKPLDNHELYNKLNCKITYEQFEKYWFRNELVIKAHEGLISDNIQIEALLKYCKSNLSIADFYKVYNNLDNSLYIDTVEIIKELKRKHYKIGLLSNLRLMDFNRYKDQLEQLSFDYMFLSYKMKCIKPNNDIYEKVINTIDTEPQNIIFFDDNKNNIEGALKSGMTAYLVTGKTIKEFIKTNLLFDKICMW